MESSTERLRALLDERGVEWSDASDDDIQHTTWNTASCWFSEFGDGWTAWGMSKPGTPEQAIAATLGSGTCEYCNGAMPIPYQYADGFSGWIEIAIDGATLFVQVGNDELAIPINYCPNCGRAVKQ